MENKILEILLDLQKDIKEVKSEIKEIKETVYSLERRCLVIEQLYKGFN